MNRLVAIAVAGLMATPVIAADIEAGETAFNRQCASCHVVVDADGNTLAGKRARTGPNLYQVIGRPLGSVEDFRYRDSIVEAGEAGVVWAEENMVAYLQDPKAYLVEATGDSGARSGMAFRVRKEEDAMNIAAFLASFGADATN